MSSFIIVKKKNRWACGARAVASCSKCLDLDCFIIHRNSASAVAFIILRSLHPRSLEQRRQEHNGGHYCRDHSDCDNKNTTHWKEHAIQIQREPVSKSQNSILIRVKWCIHLQACMSRGEIDACMLTECIDIHANNPKSAKRNLRMCRHQEILAERPSPAWKAGKRRRKAVEARAVRVQNKLEETIR